MQQDKKGQDRTGQDRTGQHRTRLDCRLDCRLDYRLDYGRDYGLDRLQPCCCFVASPMNSWSSLSSGGGEDPHVCVCIYIYIYTYAHTCKYLYIHIYIYIYRERERYIHIHTLITCHVCEKHGFNYTSRFPAIQQQKLLPQPRLSALKPYLPTYMILRYRRDGSRGFSATIKSKQVLHKNPAQTILDKTPHL